MYLYLQERAKNYYNAGFKARVDCDKILEQQGYSLCLIHIHKFQIFQKISIFLDLEIIHSKLKKCDKLFLQYPYYSQTQNGLKFYKKLLTNFSGKVECLIHDISWYRMEKKIEPELCYLLERSDRVIVHTPAMKDLLIQKCSIDENKIKILYLFDYLSETSPNPININGKTIIFAGNLKKSPFISELYKLPNELKFNLYGIHSDYIRESPNCSYKGKFHPDNLSAIEGNWGLVWDGERIDTCNGGFGEYLKINSSHKLSLYLAACKPVIVWRESSLSNFIENNKLGIVVNSLFDINKKLSELTDQEKKEIIKNVERVSISLRKGDMLRKCL